jgi:four helix bundle protein
MEDDELGIYNMPPELMSLLLDPPKGYGKRESNIEFAKKLRLRMKLAAIQVVNFFEKQPNSPAVGVIRYQLLKSSTSAAANYRAACRARSVKEFYAKMSIVVEETDETLFWLELMHDSDVKTDKNAITIIGKEWQEILMIVAKARSNTKV